MRLSVRTKLFGAFGVVIGLMLILGVVAIGKLGAVNGKAEYLGTNTVPSANITTDVRAAAANLRRVQYHLIFATTKDRAGFESDLAGYQAEGAKQLAAFRGMASDAADARLYRQTQDAWNSYIKESAA